MIGDSDHDVGDLIARPRDGFAMGVLAGVVMLAVFAAMNRPDVVPLWFKQVGSAWVPGAGSTAASPLLAGLLAHFVVAGLCGALYAACQQRTEVGGLVVVGLFYGFVLWLASELLLWRLMRRGPALLETWSAVFAVIAFGATLAAWAAIRQRASVRQQADVRPID